MAAPWTPGSKDNQVLSVTKQTIPTLHHLIWPSAIPIIQANTELRSDVQGRTLIWITQKTTLCGGDLVSLNILVRDYTSVTHLHSHWVTVYTYGQTDIFWNNLCLGICCFLFFWNNKNTMFQGLNWFPSSGREWRTLSAGPIRHSCSVPTGPVVRVTLTTGSNWIGFDLIFDLRTGASNVPEM